MSKKLGVKKQRTKLKAPSQTLPTKEAENVSVPVDTFFEPPSTSSASANDQKYINDGSQDKVGYFGVEELTVNEDRENPFWFTNDESNLCTPTLSDLLDQYSLDNFVWHGF